jgi:hypothetical protein
MRKHMRPNRLASYCVGIAAVVAAVVAVPVTAQAVPPKFSPRIGGSPSLGAINDGMSVQTLRNMDSTRRSMERMEDSRRTRYELSRSLDTHRLDGYVSRTEPHRVEMRPHNQLDHLRLKLVETQEVGEGQALKKSVDLLPSLLTVSKDDAGPESDYRAQKENVSEQRQTREEIRKEIRRTTKPVMRSSTADEKASNPTYEVNSTKSTSREHSAPPKQSPELKLQQLKLPSKDPNFDNSRRDASFVMGTVVILCWMLIAGGYAMMAKSHAPPKA